MEEVHGQHVVFVVIAEDVRVVAVRAGDALLLLHLIYGDEEIAIFRGELELLRCSGCFHACFERTAELLLTPFEKELRVADSLSVLLRCGQVFHARAQTALDVVLQARAWVVARQVELAAWQQKRAVQQVSHAIGQVAGEVGAIVGTAIPAQAAGDEDLRIAVAERELDIRIGLVVAQQDVEARLALLDEVVLERKRLALVVDHDVVDVHRFAHQRASFGVGLRRFEQVGSHPRAQVLRLANVDDLALGVLVQVHAGLGGQRADFLLQIHFECVSSVAQADGKRGYCQFIVPRPEPWPEAGKRVITTPGRVVRPGNRV